MYQFILAFWPSLTILNFLCTPMSNNFYYRERDFQVYIMQCEGAFLTRTCDPGAKYARACASKRKRAWRVVSIKICLQLNSVLICLYIAVSFAKVS